MISKGTRVTVRPTAPGLRRSYPAADWINQVQTVTLLEDAPHAGTLDVIDVTDNRGQEETIYDFNIMDVDLDAFTRGYLEAALWVSDPYPGSGGEWFEHDEWVIRNIAPESLQQAIEDCRAFQDSNEKDLDFVAESFGATSARCGHDFWLTRNHHGAGFWDRGYGAAGDRLTKCAHAYGGLNVFGPETDDNGSVTDESLTAWIDAGAVITID